MSDKANLRRSILAAGRRVPLEDRRVASTHLVRCVLTQALWQRAQTVLLFLPLPSEPDIRPLFEAGWAMRKNIGLLRHAPDQDHFQPHQIRNLSTDLEANPQFGTPEPAAHCAPLSAKQLDLILVPGIAFSWSGCRLGRGRGYYDRFLAQASGIAVGVAYDWQMTDMIPTEPHDMGVHFIVTPTRWQEVGRRS